MNGNEKGQCYDVAVVGGGVNGCGIARDLAGRGLKVLLVERRDLASGTSSASTKLVHGGLRYLEHYEFALVRESLKEREVLMGIAPHVVEPMRFVLPHHAGLRPAWLIRLGLMFYDFLGGRRYLPGSRAIDLRRDEAGVPLKPSFTRAFEYSDCWVDDARLVVLNAVDAARRGADVRVGVELVDARREGACWRLDLHDENSSQNEVLGARVLVNAAGPWVGEVSAGRLGLNKGTGVRLVKGSHIVVPRLFDHARAYIFQNRDGRIVFAIPFQGDFTLIGTTDVDYTGDPRDVAASTDEIAYLSAAASEYFATPVTPDTVVWTFSGVRPLQDDGGGAAQKVSRDYELQLDGPADKAALLHVVGGKITTYRRLAEEVAVKLAPWLPNMTGPWTAAAALPGGDFELGGFDALVDALGRDYPFLDAAMTVRLARAYGTDARQVLAGVRDSNGLGRHFGAGLYECEVAYLVANEWARTAEDILWRRGKLGLRSSEAEVAALSDWLALRLSQPAAP